MQKWLPLILPGLLILISGLFVIGPEEWRVFLKYDREAVAQGDYWRFFTANLIHSNWIHWAFNVVGFAMIGYLFIDTLKTEEWYVSIVILFIVNIILMHLFSPHLMRYVGMSGALHGLLCCLLLNKNYLGRPLSYAVLCVIIAKVIYESWFQTENPMEALIEIRVATDSHLFGVVSGIVWGILLSLYKQHKDKHRL
ncbi:MAG: rhombosortase [Pseudomonadota bacterium]